MKWFVLSVLLLVGSIALGRDETARQKADRMRWWREGRFGMFIHWGPVSLKGTEISWSRGGERRGIGGTGDIPVEVYDNLYKQFNPIHFNADEWVAVARSAGMRYMVLTAKHCDGFCLWKSKIDPYSMGSTPFGRDVCGELARAAHSAGMKIGWYYSPMDWRDPDCRTERNDIYVSKMQGHLRELLGRYGRIDLLWFDSEGGPCPWHQRETYGLVRSLQPMIIMNDRLGIGRGTPFGPDNPDKDADYATPEQRVGAFNIERPWETCMTLGTQWAWKPQDTIKTAEECIRILVQCVTGDGNLLLNVGPMPDGRIEPRQVEVLKQIGSWLNTYGESIYGTRGGPYRNGRWGGSTWKGHSIYLHILRWDGDRLELPALPTGIKKSSVLTAGKDVNVAADSTSLVITRRARNHDQGDTIIRLDVDTTVESIGVIPVVERGALGDVDVTLAGGPTRPFGGHGVASLVDGIRGTTDRMDGNWVGFLGVNSEATIDLRNQRELRSVTVGCLQDQVSRIFYPTAIEIAVSDDGKNFRDVARYDNGETRPDAEIRTHDFTLAFAEVTARFLRVRALNRSVCPPWHEAAGKAAWVLLDEISAR